MAFTRLEDLVRRFAVMLGAITFRDQIDDTKFEK